MAQLAEPQGGNKQRIARSGGGGAASSGVVIATIAVVAAMHLGRDVFLPVAIAVLITFALSPLVTVLRRFKMPMIAAVMASVTLAFAAIGMFVFVVASQVGELAQDLPTFQGNIVKKLGTLQETGAENGLTSRLMRMVTEINDQMAKVVPQAGSPDAPSGPIAVEIVEKQGVVETLRGLVLPLISPVAMAGLVIVLVVFMLLERDELRDRFIRLVGANDINRTTQVIEDAGSRVGTYLLIQLLVNIIYAVPIGFGLLVIGVPNAVLWGMLTLVLRFVPYIGPLIAAVFPLFLAFAVSPDWSMVLWTGALFLAVEMISSNVVEPWLYGSRTGVSPLAIIIAAIFWTWVWGPLGLVLSTPLTVCLVVVGRYIPQFEAFDVLFGDRPVLAAHSRLYQRLLVGDTVESTLRAEEVLEDDPLADYYRNVGIPALQLAQSDYERGALSQDQLTRIADTADHLLAELDQVVADELADAIDTNSAADGYSTDAGNTSLHAGLFGDGYRLAILGGRTRLDDLAARMLAQVATADGAAVTLLSHADLTPSRFEKVIKADANCIVLNFLDTAPSRASLLHIRRLKRAAPHMRVGLMLWQPLSDMTTRALSLRSSPAKLAEILEIGADFCAVTMDEALDLAFQDIAPCPVTDPAPRPKRRLPRLVVQRSAAISGP